MSWHSLGRHVFECMVWMHFCGETGWIIGVLSLAVCLWGSFLEHALHAALPSLFVVVDEFAPVPKEFVRLRLQGLRCMLKAMVWSRSRSADAPVHHGAVAGIWSLNVVALNTVESTGLAPLGSPFPI